MGCGCAFGFVIGGFDVGIRDDLVANEGGKILFFCSVILFTAGGLFWVVVLGSTDFVGI